MKISPKKFRLCYLFLFLIIFYSCKEKVVPPKVPPANTTDTKETPPPPSVAPKTDLTLSNVKLTKIANPEAGYTHKLSVNISNSGNSVAKGFECVVNYNCPGGTVKSAGDNIVDGGYLGANQSREYTKLFRIQCKPVPGILDLKLRVDPNKDVDETNETNNSISARVAVPF